MLPARTAESVERVAGDIIAAGNRDLLDRFGHIGNRDTDKSVGHFFRRSAVADQFSQFRETCMNTFTIEGLILMSTENHREKIWIEFPQHHICIGNGKRSTAPVAGRSRICACRVRADAKAGTVIMQYRATTCCHSMHQHHGRAHADTRNLSVESAFIFTTEMRDISRGAAHIKADHAIKPCFFTGFSQRNNTTGRTGKNSILALKQ